MFGRIPDAAICIIVALISACMAYDVSSIPGQTIYAMLSLATASFGFACAFMILSPKTARKFLLTPKFPFRNRK